MYIVEKKLLCILPKTKNAIFINYGKHRNEKKYLCTLDKVQLIKIEKDCLFNISICDKEFTDDFANTYNFKDIIEEINYLSIYENSSSDNLMNFDKEGVIYNTFKKYGLKLEGITEEDLKKFEDAIEKLPSTNKIIEYFKGLLKADAILNDILKDNQDLY